MAGLFAHFYTNGAKPTVKLLKCALRHLDVCVEKYKKQLAKNMCFHAGAAILLDCLHVLAPMVQNTL